MVTLPSRYEDLDIAFRGRLKPVLGLIEAAQAAARNMAISGGLRFLPVYGESGSGKTSAARELGTHLPEAVVVDVPRDALDSLDALRSFMREAQRSHDDAEMLIALIDQYEEAVANRGEIPSQFVEWISLLDRNPGITKRRWLILWLTTSREFQRTLEDATSRNRRVLLQSDFELGGPPQPEWASIIEETFNFHNDGALADYGMVQSELTPITKDSRTIGGAIRTVAEDLAESVDSLHDLSRYQVIMLWPVTDGQRISNILRFVDARAGYTLDWNAWYRQLNDADREQLPLSEYNRARLYFDMRLVPIAAADLQKLCRDLGDENVPLHETYLDRFRATHFFSIVDGTWDPTRYAPLRERPSKRAEDARDWYPTITTSPTQLGERISRILTELGIGSEYEETITSAHGSVRADILSPRSGHDQDRVITELKVYAPENTMPSSIRDAVKTTMRKHAQFAGFLQRQ